MSKSVWGDHQTEYFFELTPDRVLDAVEASGLLCTGRCVTLNSMENRVYEVELEFDEDEQETFQSPSERYRIVKFYRPGRWSREQILDEHQFLSDLQEHEIPAIAPQVFPDGKGTLAQTSESGILYTLFPKVGGRAPDELTDEQAERIGRLAARIHNVGALKEGKNRIKIGPDTYGMPNLQYLLDENKIPMDLESRIAGAVEKICEVSRPWFDSTDIHRIHGDCHFGNLLWNDQGPFFLDFDDMVRGPAIQDLWLIVPGVDAEAKRKFEILLDGYTQMREFDRGSLRLVEPLRALRFIHFAAWIAKRWDDPAFPNAFPHFDSRRYWEELTSDLEMQKERVLEKG